MKSSKKVVSSIFVIVAISFLLIFAGCTEQSEDDTDAGNNSDSDVDGNETVAALVNGEEILLRNVTSLQQSYSQQNQQISEEDALEELINQKVLYQHVLQDEFLPSDQEVEDEISGILTQYNMSMSELEQQLAQMGMTYDEYFQNIKQDVARKNSLNAAMNEYNVSDADAEQQINTMLQQYNMTQGQLEQQLAQGGSSYEDYVLQLKQQIVQEYLIDDLREEADIQYTD